MRLLGVVTEGCFKGYEAAVDARLADVALGRTDVRRGHRATLPARQVRVRVHTARGARDGGDHLRGRAAALIGATALWPRWDRDPMMDCPSPSGPADRPVHPPP